MTAWSASRRFSLDSSTTSTPETFAAISGPDAARDFTRFSTGRLSTAQPIVIPARQWAMHAKKLVLRLESMDGVGVFRNDESIKVPAASHPFPGISHLRAGVAFTNLGLNGISK